MLLKDFAFFRGAVIKKHLQITSPCQIFKPLILSPLGTISKETLLGARCLSLLFFLSSLEFQNFYARKLNALYGLYNALKFLFHRLTYYLQLHGTETVEIPRFTMMG